MYHVKAPKIALLFALLFSSSLVSAATRYYITTMVEIEWEGKADFKVPTFLKKVPGPTGNAIFEWHSAYEIGDEKEAYLFELTTPQQAQAVTPETEVTIIHQGTALTTMLVAREQTKGLLQDNMHQLLPFAENGLPFPEWKSNKGGPFPVTHLGFIPETRKLPFLMNTVLTTDALITIGFLPELYHELIAQKNHPMPQGQVSLAYSSLLAPLIRVALYYGNDKNRISHGNAVKHELYDHAIGKANRRALNCNTVFQAFATRLAQAFRDDDSFDFTQPDQLIFKGVLYKWDAAAHPTAADQEAILINGLGDATYLELSVFTQSSYTLFHYSNALIPE